MTDQHPITPPWALIAKWRKEWTTNTSDRLHQCNYVATQAARWGADQELEACCDYMQREDFHGFAKELLAARRPKPPRLAEEALSLIDQSAHLTPEGRVTIRRALERLQELEGTNG